MVCFYCVTFVDEVAACGRIYGSVLSVTKIFTSYGRPQVQNLKFRNRSTVANSARPFFCVVTIISDRWRFSGLIEGEENLRVIELM